MRSCCCGLLLTFIVALSSCTKPEEKSEALARKYCASCHSFPEPSLLTKKTWDESVLPQMAFRMGYSLDLLWQINERDVKGVLKSIPNNSMVTEEEWNAIRKFYLDHAPDSITIEKEQIPLQLTQFTAEEYTLPSSFPCVTNITVDSAHNKILVATRQSMLYRLDASFKVEDSINLESPAAFLLQENDQWIVACMGIMDPNDQALGRVEKLSNETLEKSLLIDSLKRPVHLASADFNADGQNDYLVAEFGNYTGGLTLLEKNGSGFTSHAVNFLPGTRKTIVKDFDNDNSPDILALVTQGDEQIVLYRNYGNFKFSPKTLLRFPPVYGSSYFELVDFNQDGFDDIVLSNGDNADYSQTLKPYHGIRIFLNNKENEFTESQFIPLHGASQVLARDFDNDSDIDLAVISFFPDFTTKNTSFQYLQNNGGSLKAFSGEFSNNARWLTMTVADIDDDRDMDIILGALNFIGGVPKPHLDHWLSNNTSLVLLRNNLSK